MVVLLQLKLKT